MKTLLPALQFVTRLSYSLVLLILIQSLTTIDAQVSLTDSDRLFLTGDIRAGYFGLMGENRDGSEVDIHEIRNRSRIGIRYTPDDRMTIQVRYAYRITSRDLQLDPGLHTTAPGNGGLKLGEAAFDEVYLQYLFSNRLTAKIGRFQTGYGLGGVISNAIIRNDSPNTDVGWTDGLLLVFKPDPMWSADLILQWHHKNAPSNTFRYPLEIDGAGTPFTFFSSVKRTFEDKTIRFTGFDITYSPDALIRSVDGSRGDYLAASVKTQMGWSLPANRTLLWGSELAYSFIRPDETVTGLNNQTGEKAGGLGFQTNLSIIDLFDNHNLGFIGAVLQPSLLTSADYWNNLLLLEVRHTYRFNHRLSAETRLRYRGDHKTLSDADQKRWQIFPYARLTYRFR